MGFLLRLSDTYIWMVYFFAHMIWPNINVSVPALFVINIYVEVLISNKDTEGSSRHILGVKRYNVSNFMYTHGHKLLSNIVFCR